MSAVLQVRIRHTGRWQLTPDQPDLARRRPKRVDEALSRALQGIEGVLPRRGQDDLPPALIDQGRGLDSEPAPVVNANPARVVYDQAAHERVQECVHRAIGSGTGHTRLDLEEGVHVKGPVFTPAAARPEGRDLGRLTHVQFPALLGGYLPEPRSEAGTEHMGLFERNPVTRPPLSLATSRWISFTGSPPLRQTFVQRSKLEEVSFVHFRLGRPHVVSLNAQHSSDASIETGLLENFAHDRSRRNLTFLNRPRRHLDSGDIHR